MTLRKKRLLALSAGMIVSLALGEVALRLLGISFANYYRADPVRGVAHRPGAAGWFTREGRQYVTINAAGFHDRDHSKKKPPGTYRIAVLGDSFAEAFQVPKDAAFSSVLARELSACPAFGGRAVEVMNFGVSNYGTAQELLTLRQCVWDYSPDLVILAFFTGNDVWDNARALKNDAEAPYFVLEDGKLVLDDSFRDTSNQRVERSWLRRSLRAAVESSRLLQLARQAWGVTSLRARGARDRALAANEFDASWYQNPIYREPTDPAWKSAWDVTEHLLIQMRDEVKGHGARFLIVTLSNGIQVHPDPAVSDRLSRVLGVPDLFYPDRRIKQLGDREGIEVLNLAEPFREFARTRSVYLHGFGPLQGTGHWNVDGHRLAGQLIAQRLCGHPNRASP